MRQIKCEICGLKTCRIDNEKRVFMAKFPLDADRCKQWVKLTGKEDLVYVPIEKLHQLKYICGKHFRSDDFQKKKNRLKRNAIPSIGITAMPLRDELFSEFPLHMFENTLCNENTVVHETCPNVGFSTVCIAEEHSYCKPNITKLEPSTPTLQISPLYLVEPSSPTLEIPPSCITELSTSTTEVAPLYLAEPSTPILEISSLYLVEPSMPTLEISPVSHTETSTSTSEISTFNLKTKRSCNQESLISIEERQACPGDDVTSKESLSSEPSTIIVEMQTNPTHSERERSCSPDSFSSILETQTTPTELDREISCSSSPLTLNMEVIAQHLNKKILHSSKLSRSSRMDTCETTLNKKLQKKLENNKIIIKNLQKQVDQINEIDSPFFKMFFNAAIKNQKRKPRGKRWTKLQKSFALDLYTISPAAYKYFSKLLPMPSIRTMQTTLHKIKTDLPPRIAD